MYLLFDFDGTLINSFDNVVEKLIIMADEFNFRKITKSEAQSLRKLNTLEVIKYLRIPAYKIPLIIHQLRNYMREDMISLQPVPNFVPVLEVLEKKGNYLGILTSNSEENVGTWLKHNKIDHLFNFIHSESKFWSKSRLVKRTIKLYRINKLKTFYIGDETRDIEAAKQNQIKSIAVTWGFTSEQILQKFKPDFIAHKPEDIPLYLG